MYGVGGGLQGNVLDVLVQWDSGGVCVNLT